MSASRQCIVQYHVNCAATKTSCGDKNLVFHIQDVANMTDFSLSLDNVTENMFDHYKVRMRTEEAMEACPLELSGILREDCQRSLYYGCIGA